jgi:hypothetical protein
MQILDIYVVVSLCRFLLGESKNQRTNSTSQKLIIFDDYEQLVNCSSFSVEYTKGFLISNQQEN